MNTSIGTVIALDGERATLALPRDACAGCGKRCGIGALAAQRSPTLMTIPAPAGLALGDRVALQFSEQALLRAALLGYLLPAALLILGALLGHTALEGDLGAALGALGGLTFGLWLVRRRGMRWPLPHSISPCSGESA